MKIAFVIFILFTGLTQPLHVIAQVYQNSQRISRGSSVYLNLDEDESVYVAGNKTSTSISYGNGVTLSQGWNLPGGRSSLIAKFNSSGMAQWAVQFEGGQSQSNDIVVDAEKNVYTTGFFDATVDFDPSDTTTFIMTAPELNAYIHKTDSLGNFEWAFELQDIVSTSDGWDEGTGLEIDASGNLIAVGKCHGTVDFDPGPDTFLLSFPSNISVQNGGYVAKYSPDAELIWAFAMQGRTDIKDVQVDNNGDILITGRFDGVRDFDPGPEEALLTAPINGDKVYFAKYSNNGDFIWAKTFEATDGRAIAIDSQNNIGLVGAHYGGDFDPDTGVFELTSVDPYDGYAAKFNSDGELLWAKSFGAPENSYSTAVAFDSDGNMTVGGEFMETINFGNDTVAFLATARGRDTYFARLNVNGELLAVKQFVGMAEDAYSRVHGLEYDTDDNLYVSFSAERFFDLNPGTDSLIVGGSVPSTDFNSYFIKFQDCSASSSFQQMSVCDSITVSPSGMQTWYNEGYYMDILESSSGCDSVITVELIMLEQSSSDSINAEACFSYTSPSGSYSWSNSGIYSDTLTNTSGCDSILTINLNILSNDTTINWTVCNSTASPSGLYSWTQSGIYTDTLTNSSNCDSVITVVLNVIGVNDSIFVSNDSLLSAPADTYQWINCDQNIAVAGATSSSFVPTSNGVYAVVTSTQGCVDTSSCVNMTPFNCDVEFLLVPDPFLSHTWYIVSSPLGFGNFTYLWDWGDGGSSSGFYSSHTYSASGYYNICLTITDSLLGCTETYCDSSTYLYKTMEMVNVTVVDELPNGVVENNRVNPILFYPNPTSDKIQIDFGQFSGGVSISAYDMLGQLLQVETTIVNGLFEYEMPKEKGIYLLRLVYSDGTESSLRVIKE